MTTVYLGADHGGFPIKEKLKLWLFAHEFTVEDCGATTLDPNDDYPVFAQAVAKQVIEHPDAFGILLCRSGGGMEIAANRFSGIRAVQCLNETEAQHAREHNNANILVLPADEVSAELSETITQTFLQTPFSGETRHERRIEEIEQHT